MPIGDTVHKAVILVFDVEHESDCIRPSVVPNEFIGISCSVYSVCTQITPAEVSVPAPKTQIPVFILADYLLADNSKNLFVMKQPVGKVMDVKIIRQAKCLLIGKGSGIGCPPTSRFLKCP